MEISQVYQEIESIIIESRNVISRKINSTIVLMYWEIGRLIVEYEQKGESKSKYGDQTLKELSKKLSLKFSKGFDESNLRNMRAFYTCFQIRDTLRHELSWSHYRLLIRLKTQEKINYYMSECIQSKYLMYLPKTEELKEIIYSTTHQKKLSNNIEND